jgi:hypothetical protein
VCLSAAVQITLTVPVRASSYMLPWPNCTAYYVCPAAAQITSTVPVRTSFYTYSVDWQRVGFEALLYLCMIFVLASQVRLRQSATYLTTPWTSRSCAFCHFSLNGLPSALLLLLVLGRRAAVTLHDLRAGVTVTAQCASAAVRVP